MLYTGRGDDGSTKTFGCNQRISKSSKIAEALGSLDEINSFLGLVKIKSKDLFLNLDQRNINIKEIVNQIQQDLFIIQAHLAGADKIIIIEKVNWLEDIINQIEKIIPPVNSFFVSGGCELATLFDIARTIARRAERRVVDACEEDTIVINKNTLAYLNRLSSILYALARFANHNQNIIEDKPLYE